MLCRVATGSEEKCGGYFQCAEAGGEWNQGLHGSFAKRVVVADQNCPVIVLHRTGNNFGRGGTNAACQDDHGPVE